MTERATGTGVPLAAGMPMLGLGTWQNDDHEQCALSVRTALEMGYRHVDTAMMYGNEAAVGDGIAAAEIDADDVFVATKVWYSDLAYDDVIESAAASREALGVETIDLLYVHWPAGSYDAEATLGALADLRDDGVVDRVGVSNFEPDLIEEAVEACDAPVFANQVECHPLLPQEAVRAACDEHGVEVVAYAPLARGEVFDVPEIVEVAEKHDASPAQVSLAWLREKGITAIPKATGRDHIAENWASLGLALDPEDVDRIDAIDRERRLVDPSFAPW
jgi:2,5-diketo-D-gluconate reductase B